MKRIEIYINSKGNLTIDLFKRYEDENLYSTYKGNEAYEFIRKLASNELKDVVENKIRDNISLEYKDYIVILNEPNILLNRKGLGPLIKNVSKFYEEESKKIVKNKKVTRKNKYSGKRILAAGLAILVIGTTAYGFSKDKVNNNLNNNSLNNNSFYPNENQNIIDLDNL